MTRRARVLLAMGAVAAGVIAVIVVVPAFAFVHPLHIDSFQRTGDPRTIVVTVTSGLSVEIVEHSAREDATTVRVTIRGRQPAGSWPAIGIPIPVAVLLRDPLGERAVLDTEGRAVRDLGSYQPPREPPIDLSSEIGLVDRASFRISGDVIDFRWSNLNKTKTESLGDLRGSTLVIVSRTPNSGDAKVIINLLEEYLSSAPPGRLVVLVVTLAGDPAAAAYWRPSASWRPLIAWNDLGQDAPEIFRLTAAPATWFVGPDGAIRQRFVGTALTRDQVLQGIATAR